MWWVCLLRVFGRVQEAAPSDVAMWANTEFVEVGKYRNEMYAVEALGVKPIVRLELRAPGLTTLVVPELVFGDLLRVKGDAAPKNPRKPMNETLRDFVTSGRTVVLTLSNPLGLDYPRQLLETAFGWKLNSTDISVATPKNDVEGMAFAFAKGPDTLPPEGSVAAVQKASLPPGGRCVYGGDLCTVVLVPVERGLVVLLGYDWRARSDPWDQVLEMAVQLGRNLPTISQGNNTLAGVGTDWAATGKLQVYAKKGVPKVECIAWRRTLNCHPSGPRLPAGDRNCSELIPATESGFCECADHQLVAGAGCSHRALTCAAACGKLGHQMRDVFGDAYAAPSVEDLHGQLAEADRLYANARHGADNAIEKVGAAVRASREYVESKRRSLRGAPWKELDDAGRRAVAAGAKAREMADVATWKPSRGAGIVANAKPYAGRIPA